VRLIIQFTYAVEREAVQASVHAAVTGRRIARNRELQL
jgi:hypothetical protein